MTGTGPEQAPGGEAELELDENQPAGFPQGDEDAGPVMPPASDGGATKALVSLLGLTPFLDLHRHYAKRQTGKTQVTRFLCFVLDLALRIVVVLMILLIIGGLAWKAVGPIPDPFWEDDDTPAATSIP